MVKILTISHESYHLVETISSVSQGIDHLNQQYNNLPEVFQVACLPVCHIPFQLKYLKIKLVPEFHSLTNQNKNGQFLNLPCLPVMLDCPILYLLWNLGVHEFDTFCSLVCSAKLKTIKKLHLQHSNSWMRFSVP